MLTKEKKSSIIETFGKDDRDTGSAVVQVALLSERIKQLTLHLQSHIKDHHSRRGLLKMVGARRSILNYLKNTNLVKYQETIEALNLRK